MTGAPLLKVCGLRDAATAAGAAKLAIDYIGFVFAPSKRRVTASEARDLIAAMREEGGRQRFVGVFVNPSLDELDAVLSEAPLDVVQLHGAETADFVRAFRERHPGVRVWKALGVSGEADHSAEAVASRLAPFAGLLDGLLLDAYDPHVGGGTGKTFRWDAIPAYAAWTEREGIPLFAAGGLHADNVRELLAAHAVGGVDVSSGVETDGAKDLTKIRTFVERVKP
ncbi:phosphoribosylanthranilate isomerase [Paenibacillus sp.]|uniref:phosphoribosylanthranilate isomerase n=1 Tax=Paenibacillus sp. TaxID=58172 RepID=UPI002D69B2D0|nr:phosphoribosylanthranilate isomerase [Paenibacillus sp.]HZG85253.1 phosphoribosylanthranilate isomerase [Paenibacillus sp.]